MIYLLNIEESDERFRSKDLLRYITETALMVNFTVYRSGGGNDKLILLSKIKSV